MDTLSPQRAVMWGDLVADYSLVQVKNACLRVGESRLTHLNPVQAHILKLLGLPRPAELFAQPVLS